MKINKCICHGLATDKYVASIYFILCQMECSLVPQRVVCRECGYILYEDVDLKTPDEILSQYNGKCPQCGKKLALIPLDVNVKPVE